jgi:hypothetical protein
MYLVRAYKPRVGRPPRRKKYFRTLYRRLHRAPWLLATSLPHEKGSGRRIKQLYALWMQIEETFRDMKCHRWGFGLRYARCHDARRLEILLLIGTLAALVLWRISYLSPSSVSNSCVAAIWPSPWRLSDRPSRTPTLDVACARAMSFLWGSLRRHR